MSLLIVSSRIAAIALLAQALGAQTTLLHEDFEDGLTGWTAVGDWQAVQESDACGTPVAPFPSSSTAAKYGNDANCHYAHEYASSFLIKNDPVHIPATAELVNLRIQSWEQTEVGYDQRFIQARADGYGTGDWVRIAEGRIQDQWNEISADLTGFRGHDVYLRFEFRLMDAFANDYLGWYIDELTVETEDCVDPANYCVARPNSAGPGAHMGWLGSTSIASNVFELLAHGAVPGQRGLFYYGSGQTQLPFGEGVRCVDNGSYRLPALILVPASGTARHRVDFTKPPTNHGFGEIEPGSTWNFQFWYRDPMGGIRGFNLSDGLQVRFCP